ncbi:phage tail tape measure protein [Alsobacter sp. R-9]
MAGELKARISLVGDEDIRRSLQELGRAGEQALTRLKNAGDRANLEKVKRQTDDLKTSLDEVGRSADQTGRSLEGAAQGLGGSASGIGASFASLGQTIAVAAAGAVAALAAVGLAANAAIKSITQTAAEAAKEINDQAKALNLSAESYQRLKTRADAAGVDVNALANAMKALKERADSAGAVLNRFGTTTGVAGVDRLGTGIRVLNVNLKQTSEEGIKAAETFKALGISLQNADGSLKSFDQVQAEVNRALAKNTEEAKLAAEAIKVYGDQAKEILPLIRAEAEAAQEDKRRRVEEDRKLTNEQVADGVRLIAAQRDLANAVASVQNQIGAQFFKGRTETVKFYTEFVDANRKAIVELARFGVELAKSFFGGSFSGTNALGSLAIGDLVLNLGQISKVAEQVRTALGALSQTVLDFLKPAIDFVNQSFEILAETLTKALGFDISAGFLQATTAVFALVGGFGALTGVIAPVVALTTAAVAALGGFGPAALIAGLAVLNFWEDITAGGAAAFAALKAASADFKLAFQALLRGDFQAFWESFKRAGSEAFAALEREAPGLGEAIRDVVKIASSIGDNLKALFNGVTVALNIVASVINAIFGTNLTAGAVAFYIALLQVTGGLQALAALSFIVFNIIRTGGPAVALVAAAFLSFSRILSEIPDLLSRFSEVFSNLFSGNITDAIEGAISLIRDLFTALSDESAATFALIAAGAVTLAKLLGATFTASSLLAGLANFGKLFLGLFLSGGPIGLALVAAGTVLYAFWDDIRDYALAAFKSISDFLFGIQGPQLKPVKVPKPDDKDFKSSLEELGKFVQTALGGPVNQVFDQKNLKDLKVISDEELAKIAEGKRSVDEIRASIIDLRSELAKGGTASTDDIISDLQKKADQTEGVINRLIQKLKDLTNSTNAPGLKGRAGFVLGGLEGGDGQNALLGDAGNDALDSLPTDLEQGFQAAFDAASAVTQTGVQAIGESFGSIGQNADQAFAGIPAAAEAASATLSSVFTSAIEAISAVVQGLRDRFLEAFTSLAGAIQSVMASVEAAVSAAISSIGAQLDRLAAQIEQVKQAAAEAAAAAASASGGGSDEGFASGGLVRGPGTPTSDSIPAWLSDGEYVVRARAVDHYGVGLLAAINNLRVPFDRVRKFASGGLVRGARRMREGIPTFATGGLASAIANALAIPSAAMVPSPMRASSSGAGASAMRPVVVNIGGQSFGPMLAPAEVASKLERFAVSNQIRSAGAKPSWR